MERLGEKYKPTKRMHDYLRHYEIHFGPIRDDVRNVVEIGVQTGNSLMLWEEYFPQAKIWGVDVDPNCASLSGGRRIVRIGDQADETFLRGLVAEISMHGGIDIVVDDGSHRIDHQMASFETLFPFLNSEGVYVIEDTGAAVGDYSNFVLRSLLQLTGGLFSWPRSKTPGEWPTVRELDSTAGWWDRNVVGFAAYRWIVFIMKGNNPGSNPFLK